MQKARRHCSEEQLRPLVGVRFQELFHSSARGAFHLSLTVLVRYRSLTLYLALPDGPGTFTQNYSCSALLWITLCFTSLRLQDCHLLRCLFPKSFCSQRSCNNVVLTPWLQTQPWFGLLPVRSPLLRESFLFSFPTGTKMFQFPAFAHPITGVTGLQPVGFSHSEILGSTVICTYPRLIAAYHVLHRS